MIEIHPRRPPKATEENQHSSGGRTQDKQRSIVILQLVHDPEKPFLRASDIAASAWERGSREYIYQSTSLRGGIIRGHLSGDPDNKDNNGEMLKTKVGTDQKEAWSISSIQNALTMEAYMEASAEINKVCDRYEAHVAEGRTNIHFYYLEEQDVVIERDLDREDSPEFPESHKPETIELLIVEPEPEFIETIVETEIASEIQIARTQTTSSEINMQDNNPSKNAFNWLHSVFLLLLIASLVFALAVSLLTPGKTGSTQTKSIQLEFHPYE